MPDYRGQRFGNYQLISLLGEGGYAQVYLGEQIYLKTQAAVKVLHEQLDEEKVEQFRFEAGVIARLDHPHIVRLLDYGVENTIPYLVMDYAPNGTLRHKYPPGTILPLPIVIRYIQQVGAALDYAHQQRVIHRDVKPENLLLNRKNEILLSDFGIAIVAHQTDSMTTKDGVGTISYIAPEQLRRRPHPTSDQYALAVLVYEWLTGNVPFRGSPIEVAMQHLEVLPPPMREPGSAFSADVERVVMRALEKHPQMRYRSVREFVIALQEAYSPHPPFTRVYEPGVAPDAPEQFNQLDLIPTADRPQPADIPAFPVMLPNEFVDKETMQLQEKALAAVPVSAIPTGERQTDPDSVSLGPPRLPEVRTTRPRRWNRRVALLALVALLLLVGVSVAGLLLEMSPAHTLGSVSPGLTATAAQQAQQGATSTASAGNPTHGPGATATPGSGTTPGTTPTQTTTGDPTPTTGPPDPNLSVNPSTLTFSLQPVNCVLNNQPKTVTIQNLGGGTLTWSASVANTNYISISSSGGSLGQGASHQISVTASCSLSVSKSDSITFTSNGGDFTVSVTITVL